MAASLVEVPSISIRDLYETDDRNFMLLCAEVIERTGFMRKQAMAQARRSSR